MTIVKILERRDLAIRVAVRGDTVTVYVCDYVCTPVASMILNSDAARLAARMVCSVLMRLRAEGVINEWWRVECD